MLAKLRVTFSLAGSGTAKLMGSVVLHCCFVLHCFALHSNLQERDPSAVQRLPKRSMNIYGCLRHTFLDFYQHVPAFTIKKIHLCENI